MRVFAFESSGGWGGSHWWKIEIENQKFWVLELGPGP